MSDIGDQDSRLVNADNLARKAKVTLSMIAGLDNLHRDLETFCCILMGVFGYACPCMRDLKKVVKWSASNRSAFKRAVSTSH